MVKKNFSRILEFFDRISSYRQYLRKKRSERNSLAVVLKVRTISYLTVPVLVATS